MRLDGKASGVIGIVQFVQKRGVYDIVRIHDYDHVVFFSFRTQIIHGKTECVCFGTLSISGFQHRDGWQCFQCLNGFFLHTVGYHDNFIHIKRIILFQKRTDRVNDDRFSLVDRKEDGKAVFLPRGRIFVSCFF